VKRLKLGSCRYGQDVQFHHHTWGYIAGAAISVVGGVLTKPKAPKTANPTAVDLQEEQTKALGGNLGNENDIENLIGRANSFQADQALSLQNKLMPGFSDLQKSITSRAKTLTDNPYAVPQEVQDNISRIAAEKGISAGTRGQFNDFSLLRDFGVNELQYGSNAINQAQSLTGLLATIAPKVNPMSPLSFYITPAQQATVTTGNNQNQQAVAQGAFNAQAAATNAGNADMWGSLTKIAGLYAGSKLGQNGQQDTSLPGDQYDTVGVLHNPTG